MARGDGAAVRKERLDEIAKTIQASLYTNKESGEIPLSKTVAQLMLSTGLTEPKITEYLHLLEKAGQFEIDRPADKIKRVLM